MNMEASLYRRCFGKHSDWKKNRISPIRRCLKTGSDVLFLRLNSYDFFMIF